MLQHYPAHERRSLRFANSCKNDEHKRRIMPVHPGGPANIAVSITCLLGCRRHGDMTRCDVGRWTFECLQGCPPSPIPAVASECLHDMQTRCPYVSTCREDDIAAFRRVKNCPARASRSVYCSDCFSRSSTRVLLSSHKTFVKRSDEGMQCT
jgi:hypothetical protein